MTSKKILSLFPFFRKETDKMRQLQKVRGFIIGPFFMSAKLNSFAVLLVHCLTGGYMLPEVVFLTLTVYQAVKSATMLFMPLAVYTSSETKIAVSRIEVSTFFNSVGSC